MYHEILDLLLLVGLFANVILIYQSHMTIQGEIRKLIGLLIDGQRMKMECCDGCPNCGEGGKCIL